MIELLKNINNSSRFILEIICVLGIAYSGLTKRELGILRYIIGVILPIVIVVIWAKYGAPHSVDVLKENYKLLLEIVIFTISVGTIYLCGHEKFALILMCILIVNTLFLYIL